MAVGYYDEDVRAWGRLAAVRQSIARPRHVDELAGLIGGAPSGLLATGLGRSYGDSGLNPGRKAISARGLDRFLAFDSDEGRLVAQAGASFDEILRLIVPRGWFLPTTPGTRFVTLAGAIANDVHGKNHHRAGSFGRHVRRIGLLRSDRGIIEVSPQQDGDLFYATLGGLGLTGLIVWAEISLARISSGFVIEETVPFRNLREFFDLTAASEGAFEHISAWVDCTASGPRLGQGVLYRGNWSATGELVPHQAEPRLSIPVTAPPGLMNGLTLKAFNTGYGLAQRLRKGTGKVHYEKAFYPLDAIGGWNRLYGPRGFYQHQFMAPPDTQEAAMTEALTLLSRSGQGSFLAVLKSLGSLRSGGLVSFEGPGLSLALDFPNRGAQTLELLAQLDEIVVHAGGRIYPAKDARMSPAAFKAGYGRWRDLEARRDPLFSSGFWRRVTHD